MTDRPAALIAHHPSLRVFTDTDLLRIAQVAAVLDPQPVGSWTDPRAAALLEQADVVIGHWGCPRLDAATLARAPRLGLVAYAAGTVKAVVSDAVFDRGIRVTSGARANAEPVAEFTLAAILFANKGVPWRRVTDQPRPARTGPTRPGNWEKVVGIVGASLVGRRVIELLRAFPALQVVVFDPYLGHAEARGLGVTKVGLDELCAAADVLTIHAPDLPGTRNLIGAPQLAALRDGATVINTARGPLLDHDALLAELRAGRLFAVLDVTDPEPLPDDSPFRRLPNAFVTPHLAGSEGTELGRMAVDVADEIGRWASGRPALNEVRREQLDRMA